MIYQNSSIPTFAFSKENKQLQASAKMHWPQLPGGKQISLASAIKLPRQSLSYLCPQLFVTFRFLYRLITHFELKTLLKVAVRLVVKLSRSVVCGSQHGIDDNVSENLTE